MRGFATFRVLGTSFALTHPIDDRIVVGREPGRRFFVIMKDETDLEERLERMVARVRVGPVFRCRLGAAAHDRQH
jgi:hypothetical protein